MPIDLPITLVAIDNVAHELMRLAIRDTLQQITPKQVLILTNDPTKIPISGAEYHHFDGDHAAVMNALWYRVPALVRADHVLWIQWDSWVLNANRWTDEFLDYDYIGAPWPVEPGNIWDQLGYVKGQNVGNGGFSLRSAELMKHLAEFPEAYPIQVPSEDDAICRIHRPTLDECFYWPSEELAARFSFEFGPEVTVGETFGFHNCVNWIWALAGEGREERARAASPFVQQNPGFQQFLKAQHIYPDFPPGSTMRYY